MARNVVAKFSAFLSVTGGDEQLFQADDGTVAVTRRKLVVAGEDEKQKLPLASVVEFDFRTVPPEWKGFFDDLVGIRFVDAGEEYTVTIGTDTGTADRFVTALLKLQLDETVATIKQKQYPLEGEPGAVEAETTVTLLPKRERITFEATELLPVDIATVTGVRPCEDGEGLVVRHLSGTGRVATKCIPETQRETRLLRTYLDFRAEIASGAGPVQFLFVGEDRDALVLVAKLLKHRNLEFEVTHAESATEAKQALDEDEGHLECLVCSAQFADTVRADVTARERSLPVVLYTNEGTAEPPTDGNVVDVVTLSSRTAHYEDVADAIERSVLEARLAE